jgi:predicted RNA methylase
MPTIKVVTSENPIEHWSDIEDLKDKIVLDLGCGWIDHGHMSTPEYFISRGASKVIGIDITYSEIEKLKDLYPSHLFVCKTISSEIDFIDLISTYKPNVIKMDVEGAEIFLKDVPKEVFSSVEEFAIEYHNSDCKKIIIDKFNELSFETTAINSFGYYCTDPNIMGIIHAKIKK